MLKYTLRKLLSIIPKLLVISFIVFFALDLVPGDALSRTMSPDAYNQLTEYQKELARESMGLNDPMPVRYVRWIFGIFQGDLGYSSKTGEPIVEMLGGRLPYTIELNIYAQLTSISVGLILGVLAAVFKNSVIDYGATGFSVLGISVPDFFVGMIFLVVFAVELKWFPAGGRMGKVGESRLPYMVLPIATMAFSSAASIVRYTRNSMLDVMEKDYIKTARSKGLSPFVVTMKHVFRNAILPVMTLIVMRIPAMIGGSVAIEQVFNYTGIGKLSIEALTATDIPVIMITNLAAAVLSLLASTLVDLCTGLLDPRVRLGE